MRRFALLLLLLIPALLLSACGGDEAIIEFDTDVLTGTSETETDGEGITEEELDPNAGDGDPAAGSCLAGDEDCTDESFDGQDVTRPVPLGDAPPAGEPIATGESTGATGQVITGASVDGATLTVGWEGGACDVLQDVVVEEDDAEVRLLVLAGIEMGVDACTQQVVSWTTTVTLDAELGDRTVVDISG